MNILKKKKLLATSSIYLITNILNAAIPFLLLPILTRYLSPADYGVVTMFGVLNGIIAPFLGLSVHGAISRQYFEKDNIDLPVYITNCFIILFFSTCFVVVFFFIFANPINEYSTIPNEWLWTIIVLSLSQFIIQIILVLWQVQVKPLSYGAFQITQTTLNLLLTLYFVVILGHGWTGRIIGQLMATSIFALLGIVFLWRSGWLKPKVNIDYIKDALKFGIPLIPHALGGIAITMTDRLFITNMIGVYETGIYAVGYQFGLIIGVLQDSFNKAWVPFLFEKLKQNEMRIKIVIVKITYAYYAIILGIATTLSLIAPWFLSFFVADEYAGASSFVLWIALGYAFDGMYKMVVNYIFYEKKTHILAWLTFLTAILNVGLNYLLINISGAVGAAQATTIAFLFTFILTWILSNKVHKMPWGLRITENKYIK